ncbi:hypothetical protein ACWEN3_39515 [Streptomyces sp. NPDC004561]
MAILPATADAEARPALSGQHARRQRGALEDNDPGGARTGRQGQVVDGDRRPDPSFTAQKVALQLKKSGASTYTTVTMVTTDSAGKLKTTTTANASGTWRWHFAGTGTTSSATAAGDGVALK